MSEVTNSSAGGLTSNIGIMCGKQPFLIVRRKEEYTPTTLSEDSGLPVNSTYKLSHCRGFVRIKEIHLKNIPATKQEIILLENLLKEGVTV